ncbi:MAG: hypothetical protein ACHQRM_16355 [Bacteroidia bacterium]
MKILIFFFCILLSLSGLSQQPASDSWSFKDEFGNVFTVNHLSTMPAGFDSVFWKNEFLPALKPKGFLNKLSTVKYTVEEVRKKRFTRKYRVDLLQTPVNPGSIEEILAKEGYSTVLLKISRKKGKRKVKKVLGGTVWI